MLFKFDNLTLDVLVSYTSADKRWAVECDMYTQFPETEKVVGKGASLEETFVEFMRLWKAKRAERLG